MKEIKEELKVIEENGTWKETALRPAKTAMPCKMVFKRKLDDMGDVCRFEARLMAKGFVQKKAIHYFKIFAPFVPFKVFQLFVGTFVLEGWHAQHAYISTAFQKENTDSELCVNWDIVVYNLKKSLHGGSNSRERGIRN